MDCGFDVFVVVDDFDFDLPKRQEVFPFLNIISITCHQSTFSFIHLSDWNVSPVPRGPAEGEGG